jgi:hypothetical protein
MTRSYWKTASGHPVQGATVVRRYPSDFMLGGHLGVVLDVAFGSDLEGYLAQVLIVDDGRRAPYQVVEGVVVCQGAPLGAASATRIRPNPTSQRVLTPEQREDLRQHGRLPSDVPMDALDGDRCVIQYLGGNEQRPYVSAFWPPPLRTPRGAAPDAPREVLEARHAGLSMRIDARGSLALSTEESGTAPAGTPFEEDSDAAGPPAPSLGGDIDVSLKPGRRIRITSAGQPLLTVRHDGSGPVLELGVRGDRPWEEAVLGGALVSFWNAFRTDLIAKLQALEAQFERFYTQEYALHQHGLGPSGTTPPVQPPPNPAASVFQPAAAAAPPTPSPGAAPADAPRTPAGQKTDEGTFARMKTYRMLSPALRVPHPDTHPAVQPDEEG